MGDIKQEARHTQCAYLSALIYFSVCHSKALEYSIAVSEPHFFFFFNYSVF